MLEVVTFPRRNLKKFSYVLSLFVILSCGADDDCIAADFVGIYSGNDCEGNSVMANITVNADGTINVELGEVPFARDYENRTPD